MHGLRAAQLHLALHKGDVGLGHIVRVCSERIRYCACRGGFSCKCDVVLPLVSTKKARHPLGAAGNAALTTDAVSRDRSTTIALLGRVPVLFATGRTLPCATRL